MATEYISLDPESGQRTYSYTLTQTTTTEIDCGLTRCAIPIVLVAACHVVMLLAEVKVDTTDFERAYFITGVIALLGLTHTCLKPRHRYEWYWWWRGVDCKERFSQLMVYLTLLGLLAALVVASQHLFPDDSSTHVND